MLQKANFTNLQRVQKAVQSDKKYAIRDSMDPTYFAYFKKALDELPGLDPDVLDQLAPMVDMLMAAPIETQDGLFATMLDAMATHLPGPEAVFNLGKDLPLTAFGRNGIACQTAPTPRHALKMIERFQLTSWPLLLIAIDEDSDPELTALELSVRQPLGAGEPLAMALSGQTGNKLYSLATGRTDNFHRIELPDNAAPYAQAYRTHLGVTPELGANATRFWVDKKSFSAPLPTADPITHDHLYAQYEDELKRAEQSRMGYIVENSVRLSLANPPSLGDIAKSFKLTERQMRFQLTKEGTSYQKITRDVRTRAAQELLTNTRLSIAEIAYRLGFADPSNFATSFQRWTGKAPRAYRNSKPD